MQSPIRRRSLLLSGLAVLGGAGRALAAQCGLTVPQMEGPYYPEGDLDRDNDLLQHKTGMEFAKGQVIEIRGSVQDTACKPIADALVEIWQACESGKYNHSDDTNNLKLDPNFQYWGRTRTDRDGNYVFRTVVPGHYPVGPGQFRPPHIHYKAHAAGFQSLTTQMYFDPESYDDAQLKKTVDRLNRLEGVSKKLTVLFAKKTLNPSVKEGRFDLVLKPI